MYEDLYVLGRPARRERRPRPDRLKTVARFVIAGGTMFLLMGWGEAIVAAPFLLPALWWAYRSSRRWHRAGFALLAGLVMAEVGGLPAYLMTRESSALVYVGPSLGFAGTIALLVLSNTASAPGSDRLPGAAAKWWHIDVWAVPMFLFAASLSATSLGFMTFFDGPIRTGFLVAGSVAAWGGYVAWRRRLWLLAAGSFLVTLVWPAGFYLVLTGSISIAFVVASLVRMRGAAKKNSRATV
jgi:hypothetical protein